MKTNHQLGDVVYFQPAVNKIDAATGIADETAIPCKVLAITMGGGKVLYDLAVPDGEGGYYEPYPLCRVDSFFVQKPPKD